MSTLKATNIKNESSASNNIVLDSGGGAIFSGVTTFSSSVNFNSIGSLTLGTGTTIGAATSNTFIVSTNGSERIRVDSLGDVGIGTTNPQYSLDVVGDINFTGTFRQNGSTFVASRWTSGIGDDIYRLSGDVGIGTTNPQTKLDVSGIGQFLANGATLNLVGTDHSYIQWYPDGIAAGRKAYTGFPGPSNNFFEIANEISDGSGHIYLNPGTNASVLIDTFTATGTASQPLQVNGGAYVSGNLGVGVTNPQGTLQVGTAITMYASTGIVSATSYRGDGSQLSGISVGTDITSCLFT